MKKSPCKLNILLLLAGVLTALTLSEYTVRVFKLTPQEIRYYGCYRLVENEKIVYELIPGSRVDGSIINRQGFKGVDFKEEKAPGLIRIAMLGDSITQGVDIPAERTFSGVLESMLNTASAQVKSNRHFEVMNFGVCGYNLEAEIEILKTKVIKYAPDMVILNYYYNDSDLIPGYHMFVIDRNPQLSKAQRLAIIEKYYPKLNPIAKFFKNLLHRSQLYLFLSGRIHRLNFRKKDIGSLFKKEYGAVMNPDEINNTKELLLELKKLGERDHFKILVCIHSFLLQGEHPNNALFADLARKTGLPYFRMYPYYQERFPGSKDNSLIGLDHCHPNEFGHQIIAAALLAELRNNRMIE